MKPSVGIVGCGRMGTALAKTLGDKGHAIVGVSSLHRTSAQRLAGICDISEATDRPWEITRKADVVFLTMPDGAIEYVCESISKQDGFSPAAVVLHCSGAHPSTILASARKSGASIGSMHPLQSFASIDLTQNPFKGIRVAIEGDSKAVSLADRMTRDLEALPLQILTEGKPLYHAAAVVASNFLVTLMGVAFRLIQQAGVPPEEAFAVLKPLIEGTLANIDRVGVHQALTGPVVRGDVQTVETHIQAIGQTMPELLPFYTCLVHYTAVQAGEGNRISEEMVKTFLERCKFG
ncbi:MAG: DUF2520 domain-containing protein [Deltaproteobacteria bacterium]|nr:DUF2520 domain-containing protein [Deltaproteobacteria bacterium]